MTIIAGRFSVKVDQLLPALDAGWRTQCDTDSYTHRDDPQGRSRLQRATACISLCFLPNPKHERKEHYYARSVCVCVCPLTWNPLHLHHRRRYKAVMLECPTLFSQLRQSHMMQRRDTSQNHRSEKKNYVWGMMPGSTGLQCVHHCRPLCRVDGSPGLYPTTMMQIISCAKALGEQITLKKRS